MKRIKSQAGSGLIIGLIILALAIAIGIFAYLRMQQVKPSLSPSQSPVTSSVEAKPTDPTATWIAYSSKTGQFSLRYSPSWKIKDCDGYLSLALGTDKNGLAVCSSGAVGVMSVVSSPGDNRASYAMTADGFDSVSTQAVTADGVPGTRTSGVINLDGPGQAKGNKLTRYIFFAKSRSFIGSYLQTPDNANPANIDDFDLMIKNTLKFSS